MAFAEFITALFVPIFPIKGDQKKKFFLIKYFFYY